MVEYNPVCLDVILKVSFSFTTHSANPNLSISPTPQESGRLLFCASNPIEWGNALREIALMSFSYLCILQTLN